MLYSSESLQNISNDELDVESTKSIAQLYSTTVSSLHSICLRELTENRLRSQNPKRH